MPKPRKASGKKNLIAENLKALRTARNLSQRKLADEFQLMGLDIDKNVITRIETQQRQVTDFEICAIMRIFQITFRELIDYDSVLDAIQQTGPDGINDKTDISKD